MRSPLATIIIKELKDLLRDPRVFLGIIVMPIIIFPIMGGAVSMAQTATYEALKTVKVACLNLDHGQWSEELISFMDSNQQIDFIVLDAQSVQEAVAETAKLGAPMLIVIPKSFSENLSSYTPATISTIYFVKKYSFTETAIGGAVNNVLHEFSELVSSKLIKSAAPNVDPKAVLSPVSIQEETWIKGNVVKIAPEQLIGIVLSQSIMLPVVIMVLILVAAQVAATSVAMEKEEKTLETLLTIPVSRFTILAGKLLGSVVIAGLGAVVYTAGFMVYMNAIMGPFLQALNVPAGITPLGYAIMGVSIFLTLLAALAIAITVSVFAEDVRGAQSLLGFIIIFVIIPFIVLMTGDYEYLPLGLKIALFAIPFSHPILVVKALLAEDYLFTAYSIAYIAAFTVAVLYIAAKFFATEKIVTAKLAFKRKARRS